MRFRWRRGGCLFRRLCSRWWGESGLALGVELRTYSRAQRYGSNARILGRAQVSRLNADFLEAIVKGCVVK
jgi:hypothetical protein